MTFRHAAVFAFMGWYLIVPPSKYRDGRELVGRERNAALHKWTIRKSFDDRSACEADRQSQLKAELLWYRGHLELCPPGIGSAVATEQLTACSTLLESLASQCVACDDPRLKEKLMPQPLP